MSGTTTGDGINAWTMLLRYYDCGVSLRQAWLDIGYSIDAPSLILAGSCVRDEFGPEPDDWFPRESWTERDLAGLTLCS